MKFLIIDTSCKTSHVHFIDGENVTSKENFGEKSHSITLLEMVDEVLGGTKVKDIDFVAVTVGPGSYTGLRIAISTAKMLAFGADVPLVPINTLDYVAWSNLAEKNEDDIIVPLLDARNNQAFYAIYKVTNNEPVLLEKYGADDIENIKQIASKYSDKPNFCGDGANNLMGKETNLGDGYYAGKLCENIYNRQSDKSVFDPKKAEAFYLKEVHVTLKNNG